MLILNYVMPTDNFLTFSADSACFPEVKGVSTCSTWKLDISKVTRSPDWDRVKLLNSKRLLWTWELSGKCISIPRGPAAIIILGGRPAVLKQRPCNIGVTIVSFNKESTLG